MNERRYFKHMSMGKGRPQILLIGNGFERGQGQVDWTELVESLAVDGKKELVQQYQDDLPFPLLYNLISVPDAVREHMTTKDLAEEEARLKTCMDSLKHSGNALYESLKEVNADHIFTTNYSYCLENSFYGIGNFPKSVRRQRNLFNMTPELNKKGQQKKEVCYRLHSGYEAKNADGSSVGLWHIHGEAAAPKGVVVGHDRYGRLLSKVERICGEQRYRKADKVAHEKHYESWPELFLYGDVYVIGLKFASCEYDLWWLLKRKQRETYSDGRVYFYTNDAKEDIKQLMSAHGAEIIVCGIDADGNPDYTAYYKEAASDAARRIKENRSR